jgi:hypothetical protein
MDTDSTNVEGFAGFESLHTVSNFSNAASILTVWRAHSKYKYHYSHQKQTHLYRAAMLASCACSWFRHVQLGRFLKAGS